MKKFPVVGFTSFLILLHASAALAAMDPESDSLQVSKTLRPISDQQWQIVTSSQPTMQYSIVKGDTLYDISKRLFGDAKYWPKIWALNNPRITNPHWIKPGIQLALSPGSGTSLPAVAVLSDAVGETPLSTAGSPTLLVRSGDWKNLPRQRWEHTFTLPTQEVDPQGFDKRNRTPLRKDLPIDLHSIVSSEEIELDGTLTLSTKPESSFMITDQVFIESSNEYATGQVLAITSEPFQFDANQSGRSGYSYPILGTVKIEGKTGERYSGHVVVARGLLKRTLFVMPLPEKIATLPLVSAPSELRGEVIKDPSTPSMNVTQHSQIILDLGSEDGVQRGMMARIFTHNDPVTGDEITANNELPFAEAQIVQVSNKHSIAFVRKSLGLISEGDEAVLVVDPNAQPPSPAPVDAVTPPAGGGADEELGAPPTGEDLPPPDMTAPDATTPPATAPPAQPADPDTNSNAFDELDSLDNGEGLDTNGQKELQQLENWKGNPPTEGAAPVSPTEPALDPELSPDAPLPPATPAESPETDDLPPPP